VGGDRVDRLEAKVVGSTLIEIEAACVSFEALGARLDLERAVQRAARIRQESVIATNDKMISPPTRKLSAARIDRDAAPQPTRGHVA